MSHKHLLTAILIVLTVSALISWRLITNKQRRDADLAIIGNSAAVIPVSVDTVRSSSMSDDIDAAGTFSAYEETAVVCESQGLIKDVLVDIGSHVHRNQQLAIIEDEVPASRLGFANDQFEKASLDLQRLERLYREHAATDQQLEAARINLSNAKKERVQAEKEYSNTRLTSPVNGIVTKRNVDKGTRISPGMSFGEIVDISTVIFTARLTAAELLGLNRTGKVIVSVDAFPGSLFNGTVQSTVIKADPSGRYQVDVRVVNNGELTILPGMYGKARFTRVPSNFGCIIPRKALVGSFKDPIVFVLTGNSVAIRHVVIAPINETLVEVRQGLSAGEVIVVSGQINLCDGTVVKPQ
jgi:RND family efflux transporter MFP subunit